MLAAITHLNIWPFSDLDPDPTTNFKTKPLHPTMLQNIWLRFGQNPSTHTGVITVMKFYTWPWSDLNRGTMTFVMQICHHHIIPYYILKFDCDISSLSGDTSTGSQIFSHLTLSQPSPRPLDLQNLTSSSLPQPLINQILVTFSSFGSKMPR